MSHVQFVRSCVAAAVVAAAAVTGGCNRAEEPETVSTGQSQSAQPANQPLTAVGCLKAGEADGTFVLTAARTTGSDQTATYQLVGPAGVNLQDHIGQRVEVSGTIQAQQEVASRTTAVPAEEDRPSGTSGTPTVVTKTEIDIKRVSVAAVKPLGETCEM